MTKHRHFAYAVCTDAEYLLVKMHAEREGLSVADYVRQCVNAAWLEEGVEHELLAARRGALARERRLEEDVACRG